MFGYETSGPAVSCWHTLKPEELKDQVSPQQRLRLDGVKQVAARIRNCVTATDPRCCTRNSQETAIMQEDENTIQS